MNNAYCYTYSVERMPSSIAIGRETETGVREVRFDVSNWLQRWPGMQVAILVTAPHAGDTYPARMHMDGTLAVWEISESDTAAQGTGSMELEGRCDGRRIISAGAQVHIMSRLSGTVGDAPEPARPWVDEVLEAAERAEKAADRAEAAGGGAVSPDDIAAAVEAYMRENPVEIVETDPTVPAWAKQTEKPTYTPEEIGAQPAGDYALAADVPTVADILAALPTWNGGAY